MRKLLSAALLLVIIGSCKRNHASEGIIKSDQDTIYLSSKEFKKTGFEYGQMSKRKVSRNFQCKGTVALSSQGKAYASSLFEGTVTTISVEDGQYVKKGQLLAMLQNDEIINLQQEYLEIISKYDFSKNEFKREGERALDDAGPVRQAQVAEVDFKVMEARYYALKEKLKILHINTEKLRSEQMSSTINVISPISGYITKMDIALGKHIVKGEPLFEVINPAKYFISLKVKERMLDLINEGDKITFSVPGNEEKTYEATIKTIGKKVNFSDSTVSVYATVIDSIKPAIAGLNIIAEKIMDDSEGYFLPLQAVITVKEQSFLFIKENEYLLKKRVFTGVRKGRFIEVKGPGQLFSATIVLNSRIFFMKTRYSKNVKIY